MKTLLFSFTCCSLLFAVGKVHDPFLILKRTDTFLSAPSFEKAFRVGQSAEILYRKGSIGTPGAPPKYQHHVTELLSDRVNLKYMAWYHSEEPLSIQDTYLLRTTYEEFRGNALRDLVDGLTSWGDELYFDSVVQTKFKIGDKKVPALEIRIRDYTPFSEAGVVNLRVVLICAHYYAQRAVLDWHIPLPGYKVQSEILDSYTP